MESTYRGNGKAERKSSEPFTPVEGGIPNVTDAMVVHAAYVVLGMAHDAEDARVLFAALGIPWKILASRGDLEN